MHVLNTTQELYGVWIDDDRLAGWIKDASGTPTIFGKQQAFDFCYLPTMTPKRLFICCEENMVEVRRPGSNALNSGDERA